MQLIFRIRWGALAAVVVACCAVSVLAEEKGPFDRIIAIGDFHGDVDRATDVLRRAGIICPIPDFYLKMAIANDRRRAIAQKANGQIQSGTAGAKETSGGSKSDDKKEASELENKAEGFMRQDIAPNMIFNKRQSVKGRETSDVMHWCGGKILVVIVGDAMDVGPDDVPLIYMLRRLTIEAEMKGGKLVFTLGNHEMNNLRGNFGGVHPLSFEATGGSHARTCLLSMRTRIGRWLRSRPIVFYYDNLVFLHAGIFPAAVDVVEKATGHRHVMGEEFAKIVNEHAWHVLQSDREIDDKIANLGVNVDYADNEKVGVLLVKPLTECDKIKEVNKRLKIQRQVVGHTPHPMPHFDYCDGQLIAVDFGMSEWKSGKGGVYGVVEMNRKKKEAKKEHVTKKEKRDDKRDEHHDGYFWDAKLNVLNFEAPNNSIFHSTKFWISLLLVSAAAIAIIESIFYCVRASSSKADYAPV